MTIDDSPRAPVIRWPLPLAAVWLAVPVLGIALRVSFAPILPHDYWWHLAMGRLIVEGGVWPDANLFLYTMPADAAFVDQPWLAQVLLYLAYDRWGHAGPFVVRSLVTLATWWGLVAVARARTSDDRAVGGFALLAALVSAGIFSVRTLLFALPLFVAALAVLLAVADERRSRRWLLALVPITALWANLHGSFALVPGLTLVVGAGVTIGAWYRTSAWPLGDVAWWTGAGLASAAAGLVGPFGARIYSYVWELAVVSGATATVTEWQPPDPTEPFGLVAVVAVLGSLAVAVVHRSRVRFYEAAILVAGSVLALSAVRGTFWWAAIAVTVVPRYLAGWIEVGDPTEEPTSVGAGWVHATLIAVGAAALVAIQPGLPGAAVRHRLLGERVHDGGLLGADNAVDAVDWIRRNRPEARIFHDQAVGGLLEYELGAADPERPRRVSFVDQRMGLIPRSVWIDYFDVVRLEGRWRSILEEWEIDLLLLHTDRQARLVEAVESDGTWSRRYGDRKHVVFVRR